MDKSLFHVIYKFCNDNWEILLQKADGHLKMPVPMTVQVSLALGCTEKEANEVLTYILFEKGR